LKYQFILIKINSLSLSLS